MSPPDFFTKHGFFHYDNMTKGCHKHLHAEQGQFLLIPQESTQFLRNKYTRLMQRIGEDRNSYTTCITFYFIFIKPRKN